HPADGPGRCGRAGGRGASRRRPGALEVTDLDAAVALGLEHGELGAHAEAPGLRTAQSGDRQGGGEGVVGEVAGGGAGDSGVAHRLAFRSTCTISPPARWSWLAPAMRPRVGTSTE